jgi:hypothetical protein
VLWAEAVRALQDNVDEFHICHCVFMVTVYSHEQVPPPPLSCCLSTQPSATAVTLGYCTSTCFTLETFSQPVVV